MSDNIKDKILAECKSYMFDLKRPRPQEHPSNYIILPYGKVSEVNEALEKESANEYYVGSLCDIDNFLYNDAAEILAEIIGEKKEAHMFTYEIHALIYNYYKSLKTVDGQETDFFANYTALHAAALPVYEYVDPNLISDFFRKSYEEYSKLAIGMANVFRNGYVPVGVDVVDGESRFVAWWPEFA